MVLLLGGTATAAKKITGKDVADSSLTGKDLRDSSVTGADVRDRSLSPRDFSESIRGPAGPPGATGPSGPSGLALLSQHVGTPATVPGSGVQTISALCAVGETAVSGGYLPTNANTILEVLASQAGVDPALGRDGWTVLALNTTATAGSMEAIAYCAPLPPRAVGASASASSRSAQSARSVLGAHHAAWQRLRRLATAMSTKLASSR